jgi:hypothetical protein
LQSLKAMILKPARPHLRLVAHLIADRVLDLALMGTVALRWDVSTAMSLERLQILIRSFSLWNH